MSLKLALPHDLLAAGIAGDAQAIDATIRACWPHAYRIAYSILRERAASEDAAQESCAILYRNLRKLRAPGAFTVWFYRIVMREALAHERRRKLVAALELRADATVDDGGSVLRIDVLHALARLSRPQRTAAILRYYAEMNSREIGEVLQVPDSTVRFHLMQAKRALVDALADHAPLPIGIEDAHAI